MPKSEIDKTVKTPEGTGSTSTSKPESDIIKPDITISDEVKYKLGKWISKIFKISLPKANLISRAVLSICGIIVSAVSVILTLLKGLGVI